MTRAIYLKYAKNDFLLSLIFILFLIASGAKLMNGTIVGLIFLISVFWVLWKHTINNYINKFLRVYFLFNAYWAIPWILIASLIGKALSPLYFTVLPLNMLLCASLYYIVCGWDHNMRQHEKVTISQYKTPLIIAVILFFIQIILLGIIQNS